MAARLGLPMMPHLRYMADVLLEYDPDVGRQVYDTGDVFVMRQVGKTLGLVTPVLVHRCTMVPHRLGRQRVSFLMHQRQKAHQKLVQDVIPLLRAAGDSFLEVRNTRARPGRSTKEWKPSTNNNDVHIEFGRNNLLKIDTAGEDAAHSDTLDVVAFDEIRFARDDRVEQGARPTMITRLDRLFLRSSTAGNELSFYMWPLVVAGRERCKIGDHGRSAYFEYSIPDDADLHDPEVWFEYHPAVGRTIDIADIMAELKAAENHPSPSKMDTFRQEYANQWVRHPVLDVDQRDEVLSRLTEVWADRAKSVSKRFKGPGVLGVDIAPNGESGSIDVVGSIGAGRAMVKVLDVQEATWWLESAMVDHGIRHQVSAVAYDAGGPAKAMAGAIARAAGAIAKATGRKCDVVKVAGTDYKAACQALVNGFDEGAYWHCDQEWLNTALQGATRKQSAGGWIWDRRSEFEEITPLPAATVAFRAFEMREPEPVRRSAYEDDDLMVV